MFLSGVAGVEQVSLEWHCPRTQFDMLTGAVGCPQTAFSCTGQYMPVLAGPVIFSNVMVSSGCQWPRWRPQRREPSSNCLGSHFVVACPWRGCEGGTSGADVLQMIHLHRWGAPEVVIVRTAAPWPTEPNEASARAQQGDRDAVKTKALSTGNIPAQRHSFELDRATSWYPINFEPGVGPQRFIAVVGAQQGGFLVKSFSCSRSMNTVGCKR